MVNAVKAQVSEHEGALKMSRQSEASVEEILESIKKVIARDNRSDPSPSRSANASHSNEEGLISSKSGRSDESAHQVASGREEESVLDLAEMLAGGELEELDGDEGSDEDAPLVAEEVRGAMKENLAALAMLAEPGARPQIVRSGETSLEGLTRELLRPMLAEWLEKNLPGMVEKLVQAEIARIAGKRR